MINTSSRILGFLENHGASTVNQISQALDLTKADIRHHIKILLHENIIERSSKPYQNGPGRPAAMFGLRVNPSPALLQNLLSSLSEWMSQTHIVDQEKKMLAKYIAVKLVPQFDVAGPPSIRISTLIQQLRPLGFNIHWEASPKGPYIKIKQEPISSVLPDAELSSLILSSLVELINKKSPG